MRPKGNISGFCSIGGVLPQGLECIAEKPKKGASTENTGKKECNAGNKTKQVVFDSNPGVKIVRMGGLRIEGQEGAV